MVCPKWRKSETVLGLGGRIGSFPRPNSAQFVGGDPMTSTPREFEWIRMALCCVKDTGLISLEGPPADPQSACCPHHHDAALFGACVANDVDFSVLERAPERHCSFIPTACCPDTRPHTCTAPTTPPTNRPRSRCRTVQFVGIVIRRARLKPDDVIERRGLRYTPPCAPSSTWARFPAGR